MNALFVQDCSSAVVSIAKSAEQVAASLKAIGDALAPLRILWLPTVGGEWPDRFTLLNRYVRTGQEPEYFTDERVELA